MAHLLKNKDLEIKIDLPAEGYNFPRFDWTGKIVDVKFQNIQLSSRESTIGENEHSLGKGFYNEFGIDTALGFEEAGIGDWFHKIGVGLLKKETAQYSCSKGYEIKPAKFETHAEPDKILISCKSENINGYSYLLMKEVVLHDNGFTINYALQNTGIKDIVTDEYAHNFMAINQEPIGRNYVLKFPFQLKPLLFIETVNPEQKVELGQKDLTFNGSPKMPFFFSNLTGNEHVKAQWELLNIKSNIGLRETGSFQTNKVNLWGTTQVISPELFFKLSIQPGQSTEWSRSYTIYNLR